VIASLTDSAQGKNVITDSNLTVPLLMRNKVPDGFESDDRLDVSLRPDEVELKFLAMFYHLGIRVKIFAAKLLVLFPVTFALCLCLFLQIFCKVARK